MTSDVPPELAQALRELPGVDVIDGSPECVLIVEGRVTRVDPGVVAVDEVAGASPGRGRLWLVNGVLGNLDAARLEDLDIGFVDRARRWWLPGMPRTETFPKRPQARRMRAPQIRMAQLLADHPGMQWTQRSLAERANSTQQTAHTLLTNLEADGLVIREGRGRSSRRVVDDQRSLRAWLAAACAPARAGVLRCYVPDPDRVNSIGVPMALTGSHGAEAMGIPVMSGDRPPVYRARTTRADLEDVPAMLGGIRTAQGANLLLAVDPGDLAHLDARCLPDGRLVAPPSRVMLDLYLEPRGPATSQVFRDLWSRRLEVEE